MQDKACHTKVMRNLIWLTANQQGYIVGSWVPRFGSPDPRPGIDFHRPLEAAGEGPMKRQEKVMVKYDPGAAFLPLLLAGRRNLGAGD